LAWDGRTALLGGGSGKLTVWDLHRGDHVVHITAHHGPITVLTVSPGGEYVVTGGEDRRVVVWTTKETDTNLF
jgi:WD40 repeat protein